ncbi:hypothetical protein C9374_011985 [Naegleria lovaniensis]|uniref:OTU domain-containing protein n=1 Tax=Naegleria lovaniensis TaxID=51637 RepID=A0AA88GGK8_NAELO|nr:uncharacterized protein C9374_011985 [Naegleria lovaniensis]KAG2373696.1 hypothetical protein C9374_011985 [Naegleria lovaniensis]
MGPSFIFTNNSWSNTFMKLASSRGLNVLGSFRFDHFLKASKCTNSKRINAFDLFHSSSTFQKHNKTTSLLSRAATQTRTVLNISIGLYMLMNTNVLNQPYSDSSKLLFLWGSKKTQQSSGTTDPQPPSSNPNDNHDGTMAQSSSIINNHPNSNTSNHKPPKMKIIKVKPDGNCLFRAVSMGLYNTEEYHLQLRLAAVDWMRSHLDTEIDKGLRLRHALILDGPGDNNNNNDIERYYLRNMQCLGVWGDFNCLVALAHCLKQPRVHFKIAILSRHNYGVAREEIRKLNPLWMFNHQCYRQQIRMKR